jgi:formylglycine-generating enzyme required for sulfatase activity
MVNQTATTRNVGSRMHRDWRLWSRVAALALALIAVTSHSEAQSCKSDLNGDGVVNASDLAVLLGDWGATCPASIRSVEPPSGSVGGGTTITISGSGLGGTTAVAVGGVPCTAVTVISATEVRATTPPGSSGLASVSVTTPAGTASLSNAFTYWTLEWAAVLEFAPDPAVVTSDALRSAIVATGLPWRVRDNGSQIELVLVPAGTFIMGCSPSTAQGCVEDENPVHVVTLTNAFYVGRYEVTQGQWAAVMGWNPAWFQGPAYPDAESRPVETVSWSTVQGFLALTGLRLPTEAEWERAYRAGTTTAFHSMPGYPNGTSDDALLGNIAWFPQNSSSQTHVVGAKAPNALGLHDMSGNVFEWVSDWYSATYYLSSPAMNPTGPASGTYRVVRGGSWAEATLLRASSRGGTVPTGKGSGLGFRVARSP